MEQYSQRAEPGDTTDSTEKAEEDLKKHTGILRMKPGNQSVGWSNSDWKGRVFTVSMDRTAKGFDIFIVPYSRPARNQQIVLVASSTQ